MTFTVTSNDVCTVAKYAGLFVAGALAGGAVVFGWICGAIKLWR